MKVPPGLKDVGVLLEPTDRRGEGHRPGVRDPAPAAGLAAAQGRGHGRGHDRASRHAGAAAAGLEVTVFGLTRKPYLNSDLIEALGARYESTADAADH